MTTEEPTKKKAKLDTYVDYNQILNDDPILCQHVDALIHVKNQQDRTSSKKRVTRVKWSAARVWGHDFGRLAFGKLINLSGYGDFLSLLG